MRPATMVLNLDQRALGRLFAQFRRTRSPARKRSLVDAICRTLSLRMQLDEEIASPALRRAPRGRATLSRIRDHHANLRRLIAEVQGVEPDGELASTVDVIAAENQRLTELRERYPGLSGASARGMRDIQRRVAARRLGLLDAPAQARGWD